MSSEMKYYVYDGETTAYSINDYLTAKQMNINAQCIYNYLINSGWSKNAICGMLGNMQSESGINPGIWESLQENNMNVGFGLVQWTPASNFINWAKARDLDCYDIISQLKKILHEVQNGGQWDATSNYSLSFEEFVCSKESPEYLAGAFFYNYERAQSDSTLSDRQSQARSWYNKLPVND